MAPTKDLYKKNVTHAKNSTFWKHCVKSEKTVIIDDFISVHAADRQLGIKFTVGVCQKQDNLKFGYIEFICPGLF